ncbi:MAG: hypothetical protein ACLGGX_06150 [Bdellovibrionia bacterium]
MSKVLSLVKSLVIILILAVLGWIVFNYYSVIFSKKVSGVVTRVERIELPVALVANNGGDMTAKMFSFAVGIKDLKTGEIFTASSEDRQWAVAEPGLCAEAEFLPYVPWNLEKKGTFFGARLLRLYECPAESVAQ